MVTVNAARRGNHRRSPEQAGVEHGYRSGLEDANAKHLRDHGIPVLFEQSVLVFVQPEKVRRYTPDFELPNGVLVETKGIFETADRQKHLYIKAQHPDKDIRFVFSNPSARINKGSPTTYAMWCERHGFQWARRLIPIAWAFEQPRQGLLFQAAEINSPAPPTRRKAATPAKKRKASPK